MHLFDCSFIALFNVEQILKQSSLISVVLPLSLTFDML